MDRLFVLAVTVPVLIGLTWLVKFTRPARRCGDRPRTRRARDEWASTRPGRSRSHFSSRRARRGERRDLAFYSTEISFGTGFTLRTLRVPPPRSRSIGNLPGAVRRTPDRTDPELQRRPLLAQPRLEMDAVARFAILMLISSSAAGPARRADARGGAEWPASNAAALWRKCRPRATRSAGADNRRAPTRARPGPAS